MDTVSPDFGNDFALDDPSFTQNIPEPSSTLLRALGVVAVPQRRRRAVKAGA